MTKPSDAAPSESRNFLGVSLRVHESRLSNGSRSSLTLRRRMRMQAVMNPGRLIQYQALHRVQVCLMRLSSRPVISSRFVYLSGEASFWRMKASGRKEGPPAFSQGEEALSDVIGLRADWRCATNHLKGVEPIRSGAAFRK